MILGPIFGASCQDSWIHQNISIAFTVLDAPENNLETEESDTHVFKPYVGHQHLILLILKKKQKQTSERTLCQRQSSQ